MARVGGSDFERIYAEHSEPLLAFLACRTGSRADAEDLAADTFERILRKRWRLDPRRGSEKTGIFAIALNLLRDDVRRRGAELRALERAAALVPAGVGGGYETIESREAVARGLDTLCDDDRELIALRYGGDMTVREIATLRRQPEPTVRGRLYRALAAVRDRLE